MTPAAPKLPEMRGLADAKTARSWIYDDVLHAVSNMEPVADARYTLQLHNPAYVDPETFPKSRIAQAKLRGETLGRRIAGDWELVDNATGKPLDRRRQTVLRVPYLADHGTFLFRGNDYSMSAQQRLSPGVFTRIKNNEEIEAHVNALPGKGRGHRYFLDPKRGLFFTNVEQSQIPLYPLLRTLGATDEEVHNAWGDELFTRNRNYGDENQALRKYAEKFLPANLRGLTGEDLRAAIAAEVGKTELDPFVAKHTLGRSYTRLNKDAVLDATKKVLAVSRGDAEPDNRDAPAFQRFMFPEQILAERVAKDYGRLRRELFRKVARTGSLKAMPAGALTPQIESALLKSGLAQPIEETNPTEMLDKMYRITRMGEGGLGSTDAIPDEARAVQLGHLGFIDQVRTPESMTIGVDLYMADGVKRGRDGNLYKQFQNAKTGQLEWKTPADLLDATVAFPDYRQKGTPRVPAVVQGKHGWAKPDDVDYVLPSYKRSFSPIGAMIPMTNANRQNRLAMGSRFTTQSLPLVNGEPRLVRAADESGKGFDDEYAHHFGVVKAPQGGVVKSVAPDAVTVQYNDGTQETHELYKDFLFNRKSLLDQTPTVQPGERFAPGQTLVKSNYTSPDGSLALGRNLRAAYTSWRGKAYEDAFVVSESAAKAMRSSHAYQHELPLTAGTTIDRNKYIQVFPQRYDKETLRSLDDSGVIKPGTEVQYGQPLILGLREKDRAKNRIHKKGQAGFSDVSVTWDSKDPGVVTQVDWGRNGPVVVVKSEHDMVTGDKLAGSYGDKGLVTVLPDGKMPHDKDGNPYDVIVNPLTFPTRGNAAQVYEAQLGKIAAKIGKPIYVPDYTRLDGKDLPTWVGEQMRKYGVDKEDDVYDPDTGHKIPNVMTGLRYFTKLHHMAEDKEQGRSGDGYTADEQPAKGGETGAKRFGLLSLSAYISHGAYDGIRDMGLIRGQQDDDRWLAYMRGETPPPPKVPKMYEKFVDSLRASGVNVVPDGHKLHLMAMDDAAIDALAERRELQNAETVNFLKGLEPVRGGLFDPSLTGGHNGGQWSKITLDAKMPNPAFEEPIRSMLGLTKDRFRGVLAGQEKLGDATGPEAIAAELGRIDPSSEMKRLRGIIMLGKKTPRDAAVKKLAYLKALEKTDKTPADLMVSAVPVLPPKFRQVSVMQGSGTPLVADANFLYRELFEANKIRAALRERLGDAGVGNETLALYDAHKALAGLGDPVGAKTQAKGVKGFLKQVFGASPKFSMLQRKLLSKTVDNVGRGVIVPNPDLDMDEIGLPENQAFKVFERKLVREMRRDNVPITRAMQELKEQSPLAKKYLQDVMKDAVVEADRAPVLHRFGTLAFRPKIVAGSAIHLPPLVVTGFNADFDGDAMQWHAITDERAIREAKERMLPSRNLLAVSDFKSPMHTIKNEFALGLYLGTQPPDQDKPEHVFRTRADLMRAFSRGDVRYDDRARVLEDE
jgi:DNA-directed RNA polymerase subunit beta